jgi:hypothetical protein
MQKHLSRREFLKTSGAVVTSALLLGSLASCGKTVTSTTTATSTAIATSTSTATKISTATATSTAISTTTEVATKTATSTKTATTSISYNPGSGRVSIGGTYSLTGAYAEDCAAILAGFQDYAKYVNETKNLAPWRTDKFYDNISIDVLWRDDELKVDKTLSIYDELKAAGLMVQRVSGSAQAQALLDPLYKDHIGATSQATGPYLMTPPKTVFSYYPIYTDALGAIADWFKASWKGTAKPRVAYLTADSALGKSCEVPEMRAYLESIGYEFAGTQYVPQVPTSPPTTQLMWLKENNINLTLGCMVNPGSQPTVKEATRLGMGPSLDYKITFGFAAPAHLAVFAPAMGTLGNGCVVGGSFLPMDDMSTAGNKFLADLQTKYRPTAKITHVMYVAGVIEAMVHTEALRLALQLTTLNSIKAQKVLDDGFYRIKDLDTGGLAASKMSYGLGKIEGVDQVRIDQVENGKVVNRGFYPLHHIYAGTK